MSRHIAIIAALLVASAAHLASASQQQQKHHNAKQPTMAQAVRATAEYVDSVPIVKVDGPNENCANAPPAPTMTWTTSCTSFNQTLPNCWTPSRVPGATDVLFFPRGSKVDWNSSGLLYEILTVNGFIVDTGATITMMGDALQVTNCLLIRGTMNLIASGSNQGPWKPEQFLPDPNQPEGTDCALVQAGFTPRICGPGRMVIANGGSVSAINYYASFFLSGLVQQGGSMLLNTNSFWWGNMTVEGTFTTMNYAYAHGFINILPTGAATLGFLWYDKWATSFIATSAPLLINNLGGSVYFNSAQLNTNSAFGGTYRSLLINRGQAYFNVFNGANFAGSEFDIFNFGTISFLSNWYANFQGIGTTLNKGTMIANGTQVFLSSVHSYGGTLQTLNGGSFSFGNGATNPKSLKFCELFGDNAVYRQHVEKMVARKQALEHYVDSVHQRQVERLVKNNVRYEKTSERECWWYFSICYSMPYLSSAPDPHLEERIPVKVADRRMKRTPLTRVYSEVTRLVLDTSEDFELEAPCHIRYAFTRTAIIGDGTSGASVVTTMPIEVSDYLLIHKGGRWFPIMDRKAIPFRGDGDIIVGREGTVVASVEADFKNGGRVVVQRGGQFVVPAHAKILFTNESLFVARGGVLHVDGQLSLFSQPTKGFHDFINCGLLFGTGKVFKEREADLSCEYRDVEQHQKKKPQWKSHRGDVARRQ